MKKGFKLFAIIAVLAIIGFSITACGEEEASPGVLTLTNFPREGLVGDHWILGGTTVDNPFLIFAAKDPFDDRLVSGVLIPSSGSIALYVHEGLLDETCVPFIGNTTIPEGGVRLMVGNSPTYDIFESGAFVPPATSEKVYRNTAPITFTNGSATINFATQMEFYEP